MQPWAVAKGITKTFGQGPTLVRALTDVDLEVCAGELTMIQGPSGSGKTTLLQILGLLQRADAGEVWIAGRRLDTVPESRLARERRNHVAFVFQGFNLLEALTVRDNVCVGAWLGMSNPETETCDVSGTALADKCLRHVGLGDRARHLPHQLSGGEKQRTSIARALACPGRLVLADEPTANLDFASACDVMERLRSLAHDQGRAVVCVSHDARLERFADKIVGLVDGRITALRQRNGRPMPSPTNQYASRLPSDGDGSHRVSPDDPVPPSGTWRLAITSLIVLVIALAAAAGWWLGRSARAEARGSRTVSLLRANAYVSEDVVAAAPAVVEPVTKLIALGSERPGRIKAILKNAGDPVQTGEPVVLMECAVTAAVVDLRRADVAMAEADRADLRAWHRPEDRAQAKARLDRAQALLDRARREHRRIETLHADGSAPRTELDEATEEVRIAEAEFAEANEAHGLSEAGPTAQELIRAEARVDRAEANLKLAEAELDLYTLRSPIDGHLVYRHREPGEIVDAESDLPIVSLGHLDQIRLRAEVDEADIARVYVDQPIIATADALGDRQLKGRVVHMEPIMGRKSIRTQRATERKDTKVREVLIELEPGHPKLPIDLQMTVRFFRAPDSSDGGDTRSRTTQ